MLGQRVGRLLVIERAPNGPKNARWLCRCDCGQTKVVEATLLRRAATKSCGCLWKESATKQALRIRNADTLQACGTVAAYRRGCRCESCVAAIRSRSEKYYRNNRAAVLERSATYQRLRKYGLTKEQWQQLFDAQDKRCKCCGTTTPGHKFGWHTDHDHKTGAVRGIICARCNLILGWMGDNEASVEKTTAMLVRYLRSTT